jgi:hypothetical protein
LIAGVFDNSPGLIESRLVNTAVGAMSLASGVRAVVGW